jgi:hypothetical protein
MGGGPPIQFIFIVGASGSGTTMLLQILGTIEGTMTIGGNQDHIYLPNDEAPALELVCAFNSANMTAWDRYAPFDLQGEARRQMRRTLEELLSLPGYGSVSDVIFKRSAPFLLGDRYRPDLSDLLEIFPKTKVVAIYRDPRASTVSSLRRKFADHLRRCAIITEEQLTYLSSQLSTLPTSSYLIVRYESVCSRPDFYMQRIATFLEKSPSLLMAPAEREKIDAERIDRWKETLDSDSAQFLNQFFDDRRCQQWPLLLNAE